MESEKKAVLIAAGIQCDEALERFMGNESMLEKFLKKFLDDGNYKNLVQAAQNGSAEEMLTAAHTLKGVCGNLAFGSLFTLLTQQVQALRDGRTDAAIGMMAEITDEYGKVTAAIREQCC